MHPRWLAMWQLGWLWWLQWRKKLWYIYHRFSKNKISSISFNRAYTIGWHNSLIILIIFTDFWSKEAANTWCPNSVVDRSINTQGGCQALCEAKSRLECVGISYSHKGGSTDYCYLCNDDTTESSVNEFGFYRRPGISEIAFSWSKPSSLYYYFLFLLV